MRTASVIARYLTGVIFLVMGLNGFLNFIPLPPAGGVAGQFMAVLYVSHYLWVIFAFQVIAGVLLLVNRYVPLAVAVLAPIIVNILTFHASMAPSGLPLALFVAVLWTVIFIDVRPAFAGLFQSRPDRSSKRSRDLTQRPRQSQLTLVHRKENTMTSDRTILITGVTGKSGRRSRAGVEGQRVPSTRPDAQAGQRAGGGVGAPGRRHRQG